MRKSAELKSLVAPLGLAFFLSGCTSLQHVASNKVADALAANSTTFAADDDPELIKQAVPFSLKLMESILAEEPRHKGLLLAACSGFTQYAFAFVQEDGDEIEGRDFAAAEALRKRSKKLYLRARDYGLRGLDVSYPGLSKAIVANPREAVARVTKGDVALLYWTAAALGGAISVGKDDPSVIAQLPQMEALINRAAALDSGWGQGAIESFLITYEMSRPDAGPNKVALSRAHFEKAIQLSKGEQAGPFVNLAEAVCVEQHDRAEFSRLLDQALAVNADAIPELRLANLVMQRRARWLQASADDLFLSKDPK